MNLLYSQACNRCIARYIGPALDRKLETRGASWCGGCGRVIEQHAFSYWYPWPDSEES